MLWGCILELWSFNFTEIVSLRIEIEFIWTWNWVFMSRNLNFAKLEIDIQKVFGSAAGGWRSGVLSVWRGGEYELWISLHLVIIWCEVSPVCCCCVSIWNVIRLLTKPRSPSAMFTLSCVFASPGIVLILPYLTYYTVSPRYCDCDQLRHLHTSYTADISGHVKSHIEILLKVCI